MLRLETVSVSGSVYYHVAVLSKFLAEPGNMYINGSVQHITFVLPDIFQYIFA